MFMVSGTAVNIWMTMQPGSIPQPTPGSSFYVDDTGQNYEDNIGDLYQDGEPS